MKRVLAKATVRVLLSILWVLRRIDYYINGSTSLRPVDAFRADPYASFELVRRNGSVLRSYSNRGWILLGYNEVKAALTHPDFSSDFTRNRFIVRLANAASGDRPFPLVTNPPLLNQDPPNHTRLRRLASQGFSNRYVMSLEPRITELVAAQLDRIQVGAETGIAEFDLIASIAEPLPAMVIAEMMGVPEAERHRFLTWSHALTGATMLTQPELMARAADAEYEMRTYLNALVHDKRGSDTGDVISRLIAAQDKTGSLSRDEVVSTCILLLTAGHETTTRLIGNGLYTLLQHPEQLQELIENRGLLGNTIEEVLRFEPPVQETVRFIARDTRLGDKQMRAGQMVLVNFAAANRDPLANPEPGRFDIHREKINHVGFGYGIHLCLGLSLARLEARVVLNALFDRFDRFEYLDETPPWQWNPFFRGLDHLNIRAHTRVS